ncbi:hypothetical protein [Iningainema tapete]|uniref:Uncharacterized protein n=1 Tax=Iningainema tapete BLCC-T55 TaxID=2748662 RepID=A0A8J7C959_9CYAN|nr:hypothetical protein [Iningainema tapete]MBD2770655.1 hypothetical protein [Iningainema tapete BLCC-T55]
MKLPKFSFTRLTMYTGYVVGLVAALLFISTKDPQVLNMVPLAKVFVDTAQISAQIEKDKKPKQLKDKQDKD